jgi:hypothetical protein
MVAAMPGRGELFGIGRYSDRGARVDLEIGWPEFDRDVVWATRVLSTWGIEAGDHVLLTVPNFEGPWASPVIRALRDLGTVHSNAEPYGWDARRSSTFLRLMPIRAVIGMSAETAAALLEQDAGKLLGGVPLIWARPAAIAPLRAAGLAPAVFAMVGPAVALECPQRAGAHLDPAEWRLDDGPHGATLRTVGDRAHLAGGVPVAGTIEAARCPCGLPGQRLKVDLR